MAQFEYSASDLYTQVLNDLGIGSVSSDKRTQLRNQIQQGLIDCWMYRKWTWRLRHTDVTVTASTPSPAMPENCDALAQTTICRVDSSGARHCVTECNRDTYYDTYERGSNDTAKPYHFFLGWDDSDNRYHMKFAPPADGSYTYDNVPYWASAPLLSWTAPATTPDMPTEFHMLWYRASMAFGAETFSLETAGEYQRRYDRALAKAAAKHDEKVAGTAPRGVWTAYDTDNLL